VAEAGFRDLLAYQRAFALACELHRATRRWPTFDRSTVGFQLADAAHSVGANIAEAWGRGGFADRRRILFIARGSAAELQHWLASAEAAGLALPDNAKARAQEVGRLLNGLIRSWS
jgi:four helix bundle protein